MLLIGWFVGLASARFVRTIADRIELDRAVLGRPLGRILGGTEQAISRAFGTLTKCFVYAVAILAASNVLAIDLLSEGIATAVSHLPAFVAGLVVIILGFVIADFIGDAIQRTRAATQTEYTTGFAAGTRLFLYFTAIVIGLDTMGVDIEILLVFATPSPGDWPQPWPSGSGSPSAGEATTTSMTTPRTGWGRRRQRPRRRGGRPRRTAGSHSRRTTEPVLAGPVRSPGELSSGAGVSALEAPSDVGTSGGVPAE